MDVARQREHIAAHTPYLLRGGIKMMPKHTPAKRTCVHRTFCPIIYNIKLVANPKKLQKPNLYKYNRLGRSSLTWRGGNCKNL